MDSRDSQREERLKFLSETEGGIWDCTRCYMCVQACPKDVLPMDAIMELRTLAIEAGFKNTHGARHHEGFTSGVRKRGRLDEMLLADSVGRDHAAADAEPGGAQRDDGLTRRARSGC